jgi:hypothetical protein
MNLFGFISCFMLFVSHVSGNSLTFYLKNKREISNPVVLLQNEEFTVQYLTENTRTYSFSIISENGLVVYSRIEEKEPYFLYGDKNGVPRFSSLKEKGRYKIEVKDTDDFVDIYVNDSISSETSTTAVTTPSNTSLSSTTMTVTKTTHGDIDLKYCQKSFPVDFDATKDHISLHYDMSYDPDDYMSAVADRAVLETLYDSDLLLNRSTRVIGTCGGNCSGYNKPADKLMQYTYGDVGGFSSTVGGKDASKYTKALQYEFDFFKRAITRSGRVFVKEGGESDFTKRVVEQLESWKKGSGKCVYVVQHSSTNEKNNGAGVLNFMKEMTNYIKISDGNPLYRKSNYKLNNKGFDFYALQSRWTCAWQLAFDDFKLIKSYCNSKIDPVTKCVDFSDTHELLYILGINKIGKSGNLSLNSFVEKFLFFSKEKHVCSL